MSPSLIFTKRAAILLVILFCLVGGWFRLWGLGIGSLWIDEGYTINASNAILKNGYPLLDSGLVYDNGLLSTYSVAGMIKLVGLDPFNPWAARLPAALAGIGVIAATYALGRALFGGYLIGLVSAGFIALMNWEIAWSRQSRGYTMLTLFLVLAALFLWRYLQNKKWRDLLIATVAYAGAFLSTKLAVAFLPAFGFIALAYLASAKLGRITSEHVVLLAGALVVLTWTGLSVMVGISTKPVGYLSAYSAFFFELGPVVLTFAAMGGIALGLFDRRRSWPVAVMTALLLLPALIIIGYSSQLQYRYLFPLIPFMVILSVYAVTRSGELVLPFLPVWGRRAAAGGALVLACLPLLTFSPHTYYALEWGSPQPAFDSVFTFIKPLLQPDDVVLSGYPHLHRIYLNTDGMWLAMPLAGRWQSIKPWMDRGIDRYIAAPAVVNNASLKELLDTGHGYAIVDNMTRARLRDSIAFMEQHPNVEIAFVIRTSLNETTTVYQFRQPVE